MKTLSEFFLTQWIMLDDYDAMLVEFYTFFFLWIHASGV